MQEKAEKWPRIIRRGGAEVKIYRINNRGRTAYQVAWWIAGKRCLKNFARFNAANVHANQQASLLSAGHLGVARMHDTDRQAFVAAAALLRPLGVPLLDAVKTYVAATKEMRGHGSLLDAAKEFSARQKTSGPRKIVSEVVEEFLAIRERLREQRRTSIRDVQTLRTHLRRFAAAIQIPIQSVQVREVNQWLRANSEAAKTFNNMRTSVVRLFNFARDQGYLPQSERTAADMAKREKLGESDIVTLPPSTLCALLKDADDEAALWISLAAFTGMRTAELLRLHWQHLDFGAGVIRLPRQVTKTGAKRQIPILPNLRAWLEPYTDRAGLVFASEKAHDRTIAYAKSKEIEWPPNWARHSFGTYRATITKSIGQVSLEMGNSEAIVKRHYFDQHANEKDAREWFTIMPAQPANVVPMKGAA
jgi:integrase